MRKGEETKTAILATAMDMASRLGLECVTIGLLAKEMNLSKSGLFAHFQSKENLQIEILEYAADNFTKNVVIPATKFKAGIPRIRALIKKWITWGAQLPGGCVFVTASTEYSDRPGKVREKLLLQQEEWVSSLRRFAISAVKAGDFRSDIDPDQFAFDLYSMLLGFHFYHQLLHDDNVKKRQELALRQLLNRYSINTIDN